MEQFRLGTVYGEVARRVAVMVKRLGSKATLAVDATGVGAAALELIRKAELGPGCWIVPVVITAGERAGSDGVTWHVPKPDLIAVLEVMLETEELVIARDIPCGATLRTELRELRMAVSGRGWVKYGAKEGGHDDLVIAVALAYWRARSWGSGMGERGRLL